LSTTVVAKAPFSLPPIYIRAPPLSEMRWERTGTCRCGAGRSSINSPPRSSAAPKSPATFFDRVPILLAACIAAEARRQVRRPAHGAPLLLAAGGSAVAVVALRRPSLSRSIAYVRTRIVTITRGRDSDRDSMVLEAVTEVRPTVWPAVISGFSH
jgi:hypothetical protein